MKRRGGGDVVDNTNNHSKNHSNNNNNAVVTTVTTTVTTKKSAPRAAEFQLWTNDDVCSWARDCRLSPATVELLRLHEIDGLTLSKLRESDLREPPIQMKIFGEMK
jgi:hypothetical protein